MLARGPIEYMHDYKKTIQILIATELLFHPHVTIKYHNSSDFACLSECVEIQGMQLEQSVGGRVTKYSINAPMLLLYVVYHTT